MKTFRLASLLFIFSVRAAFGQLTIAPAGSLHGLRELQESQPLPNGNILVFGGDNGYASSPLYYRAAEIYNEGTNNWTYTDSMSIQRGNLASAVLNDGRIMAIGGYDAQTGNLLSTCEWYDPTTGLWSAAPSMLAPRYYHRAVRLTDGKILVVGGLTSACEVFDPAQQKWIATGNAKTVHGQGFSLTLLANGTVLAVGGQSTTSAAEVYDPATGAWTNTSFPLQGSRAWHSAVLLSSGNVLIAGSTQISSQTSAELFNPGVSAFNMTGALHSSHATSPAILMDDGGVLTYGMGDFMVPSNTKVIETFYTSNWTFNTYTFVGTQGYTLNRLNSGKILVIGGSATTGNGATTSCLLITPSQGGSCTTPDQTLALTTSTPTVCYGNGASVQVALSEVGVSYRASIGGTLVGSAVAGNGGNISLAIPANVLAVGNNIVRVRASKSGCNAAMLNNNVDVLVSQTNLTKPTVSPTGSVTLCSGFNSSLSASSSPNGYLWCTGATTQSITVSNSGSYYFYTTDNNGCLSMASDTAFVNVLTYSASCNAGSDLSSCVNGSPVQVNGSPAGGTWSGTAISSSGLFTPSVAGTGTFTLVYSYCGSQDNMQMVVNPPPNAGGFGIVLGKKTSCPGFTNSVTLNNTNANASYSLTLNSTGMGSQAGSGNWSTGTLYATQVVKVTATLYASCGTSVVTQYDTILIHPYPAAVVFRCDTVCYGDSVTVTVLSSQAAAKYVAYDVNFNSTPIGDTGVGTGSNLVMKLNRTYAGTSLLMKTYSPYGCTISNSGGPYPKTVNRQVIPGFTTSTAGGFPGDVITFSNTTTSGYTYTWNVDGTLSNTVTAAPVSFNTTGPKKVTLTAYTTLAGCYDSISKYIYIVSPSPTNPGTVCSFDSLQELSGSPTDVVPGVSVYAFHVDKHGNSYVALSRFIGYFGSNYSGSYGVELRKYNSGGTLLWEKVCDYWNNSSGSQYYCSNFIVDIETDNSGNLYVAGNFGGDHWQWNNMSISNAGIKTTGYLLKLDSTGYVKWAIKNTNGGNSENGFTDIIYQDDNNIFVSCYRPYTVAFTNTTLYNGTLIDIGVFKIDKDGNLLKSFQTNNQYNFGTYLLSSFNPNPSGYQVGRIVCLNPKMLLRTDGKILVSGKSVAQVKFPGLSYQDTANYWTGFVATLDTALGWSQVFSTHMQPGNSFPGNYLCHPYLNKIAVDQNNNIYMAESYNCPIGPPSISIILPGQRLTKRTAGSLIIKYDPSGNLQWMNDNTLFQPASLVALNNGNILTYGFFSDFYAMNSQNGAWHGIRSLGSQDGAFFAFDATGNTQWVQNVGSSNFDTPYWMKKEPCSNRVFFGGSAKAMTSFHTANVDMGSVLHSFSGHYSYDNSCSGFITPTPTVSVANATVCNGASTTLQATGASSYSWSPTTGLSSGTGASVTASPSTTTTYSINATDAENCPYTGSALVTVDPSPTITLISDTLILCAGDTANLTASGANTFTWSTSQNGNSISVTPTVTSTYTVTGSGSNGCTATSTISLTVFNCSMGMEDDGSTKCFLYPNPASGSITLQANHVLGNVIIYNATGNVVYRSFLQNNSETINICDLSNGLYTVRVGHALSRFVKSE